MSHGFFKVHVFSDMINASIIDSYEHVYKHDLYKISVERSVLQNAIFHSKTENMKYVPRAGE